MIITNRPAAFLAGVIFAGLILTGCATRSPQPATAETPPAEPPASSSIDGALGESLARQYMAALIGTREETAAEARLAIVQSGDTRFVAVFLELMRARLAGIVGGSLDAYVDALQSLSGESFGADWTAWVVWYGGADLIPPLEHAPMIRAVDADYLLAEEPVFGIEVNGDARAYPLRIVDNHEMANDTVGGVPVSLAYCTLCGAAIAFDGRAPNGQTYRFGTSGFLYRSNKLMYDRTTGTLWNQLTGEPVLGELAGEDLRRRRQCSRSGSARMPWRPRPSSTPCS